MVMRTELGPGRRESLHGRPGWTRRSGVAALLASHMQHCAGGAGNEGEKTGPAGGGGVGTTGSLGTTGSAGTPAPSGATGSAGTQGSFARFEGLTGPTARALLAVLPEGNLGERQNGGPRCDELLRAAGARPGEVELSGYLVSPPRWDERVGIDGVVVGAGVLPPPRAGRGSPRHALVPVADRLSSLSARQEVWEGIRHTLGLGVLTQEPDELLPFLPDGRGGHLAWWLWWD